GGSPAGSGVGRSSLPGATTSASPRGSRSGWPGRSSAADREAMARKPRKPAGSEAQPRRPAHWEKRVSAAYFRTLGATQAEAARAVGRSERTIRLWESEPSWADARREAEERWLADLKD